MGYYDDDDEYSSDEEDLFYHNYSVDYANQMLSGQHGLSSSLPRQRRHRHRRPARLVRVSTWDQMPLETRHRPSLSLNSRPKYDHRHEEISPPSIPSATRLPSLEATSEELERRATRRTTEPPAEISSPMSEAQLRQVQQQQEAFQQHLMNIQRHLNEQSQQQQQQEEVVVPQRPISVPSEPRRAPSARNLDYEDDQAEIADLIERDPYFAAAMEDFVHSHGLMHSDRHRSHSDYSSSSSSVSSSRSRRAGGSNKRETILIRELHGIRRLMEKCLDNQRHPPPPGPARYPTVQPEPADRPSTGPRERRSPVSTRPAAYENVVISVKEALQTRRPSQIDQPLLPSQIDPRLKRVVRRPPPVPPNNERPAANRIPDAPPYEALSSFSSTQRSISDGNRRLSYGNERNRRQIYDRFERRYR